MTDTSTNTLEDKLAKWLTQPGAVITTPERTFIKDMRTAAADGVGYGWMQQIIEWEWQSRDPGHAWGPEYFRGRAETAEADLAEALEVVKELTGSIIGAHRKSIKLPVAFAEPGRAFLTKHGAQNNDT